jgi:hypothetical protein
MTSGLGCCMRDALRGLTGRAKGWLREASPLHVHVSAPVGVVSGGCSNVLTCDANTYSLLTAACVAAESSADRRACIKRCVQGCEQACQALHRQ